MNCKSIMAILLVGISFPVSADDLRKGSPQTALDHYLLKKDSSYVWKKISGGKIGSTEYAGLVLTSQTWQGLVWKHQLYVLKPESCETDCRNALLLIGGGSWKSEFETVPAELPREAKRMASVAEQLKCPVAVLLQVPNQPIFDGKYEDQIIAYTFEKFIRTGKSDWPLLLPMVKSAHRAIDTTVDYAKKQWKLSLDAFTVTGASKRGWTTWLSGATDRRVTAIAPMVIDVLNMKPQMDHQKSAWGKYSNQIRDYTDRGLQELLSTEKGKLLREIVDPYSYRERLTQPKLLFIGTNDAYWPIDALKFYWDDLKNQKYVVYVPNNGHSLQDYTRMIGTLNGFQMAAAGAQAMPEFNWKFSATTGSVQLTISTVEKPDKIQLWSAKSETRDFRNSQWKAKIIARDNNGNYQITVRSPESGSLAFFGEGIFNRDNFPCYLSTNARVLQAKTPNERNE